MFFNGEATNGPVGNLGTIGSSTVLGTWKLTFNNDTNVTITSPDNTSTSLVLPADVPPLFAEPLTVYFGAMPNEVANIGQLVVLGGVKIENGPTTVIEDTFAAPPLDDLKWALAGADNPGIVLVPSDAAFWLSWTLPDLGFTLQASTNVAGPYVDSPLSAAQFGGKKRVIVPTGVPGSASGYFRLLKP